LFIIWDFLYRKVLGHFPKGKNTRKYVKAGRLSKLVLLAAQPKGGLLQNPGSLYKLFISKGFSKP
jgi:hypothetical protein